MVCGWKTHKIPEITFHSHQTRTLLPVADQNSSQESLRWTASLFRKDRGATLAMNEATQSACKFQMFPDGCRYWIWDSSPWGVHQLSSWHAEVEAWQEGLKGMKLRCTWWIGDSTWDVWNCEETGILPPWTNRFVSPKTVSFIYPKWSSKKGWKSILGGSFKGMLFTCSFLYSRVFGMLGPHAMGFQIDRKEPPDVWLPPWRPTHFTSLHGSVENGTYLHPMILSFHGLEGVVGFPHSPMDSWEKVRYTLVKPSPPHGHPKKLRVLHHLRGSFASTAAFLDTCERRQHQARLLVLEV